MDSKSVKYMSFMLQNFHYSRLANSVFTSDISEKETFPVFIMFIIANRRYFINTKSCIKELFYTVIVEKNGMFGILCVTFVYRQIIFSLCSVENGKFINPGHSYK